MNATPPTLPTLAAWRLSERGLSAFDLAQGVGVTTVQAQMWLQANVRISTRKTNLVKLWMHNQGINDEWRLLWRPLQMSMLVAPPSAQPPVLARRTTPLKSLTRQSVPQEADMPPFQMSRQYLSPKALVRFGLAEDPFEDPIDCGDLSAASFTNNSLKTVDGLLRRCIERRDIVALCAEPGAGKSTLLRVLRRWAEKLRTIDILMPATLDRDRLTPDRLAIACLRDLGENPNTLNGSEGRNHLLHNRLTERSKTGGRHTVLIIDEAHSLTNETLVGIKRLWDTDAAFKPLAVLLVGQPLLKVRLQTDAALREVTMRTRLVDLPAFTAEDCAAYLAWRFARVGGDVAKAFSPSAINALAAKVQVPLAINNLAVLSMERAAHVGDSMVTAEHVGRA